jgi:hypothetical protein
MNATFIAVLAFAGILGAVFLGMRLRSVLPDHHLSAETKDTVRVGMGLIATMTALLLGLLIASAKGSYDIQRNEVIQMAAKVAFIDRALAIYGPETAEARDLLRRSTESTIPLIWQDRKSQETQLDPAIPTGQALYESLQKLAPQNDQQRALKAEALAATIDLGNLRWLLFAQADSSIAKPFLVIVIIWLAVIFLSFGLFAPSNRTVIVTMIVVALSVSTAIFLILELDQPFNGVIQISSEPVRNAINHLGR